MTDAGSQGRVRGWIGAGACAGAAVTAYVYGVDPLRGAYPQCLLHQATGLYCAGCGATRALHALLHGRLFDALHDNALFIVLLPVVLVVAGNYLARAWRADAWPAVMIDSRRLRRGGAGALLVLVLFMVARNLPGPAFEFLRPLS